MTIYRVMVLHLFTHWREWQNMLKMFSTQCAGIFQKIQQSEEYALEDGARLLAQAAVGEGNIYIKGWKEMQAVEVLALEGPEPLWCAKKLEKLEELIDADRVLLLTRFSNDKEAAEMAKQLNDSGIPFIAVAGKTETDGEDLESLSDVFIQTHVARGLIPGENGGRVGFADTMAATFIYYGLQFAIDEMMADYED
ncbi:DUF2529 family protein [Weizmannia acidilactici]|nr:DUF2529 family protein [Weizmannia acidilactici]